MAKRRYRSRRRGRARRFRYRVVSTRRRRVKQPTQYFTRSVYLPGYFALAIGPAVGSSLKFQLSQVPNVAEFTNLYDQYKIKAVKCTLIPRHTEVGLSTGGTVMQGNMWSCLDYDDSTIPGGLDSLLQYQNTKRTRMNQTHSRYLRPMVATEVYATSIASSYAPKRNVWLDCSIDSVEHYGIKFWFDQRIAPVTYDVQIKYYLAFKNVR